MKGVKDIKRAGRLTVSAPPVVTRQTTCESERCHGRTDVCCDRQDLRKVAQLLVVTCTQSAWIIQHPSDDGISSGLRVRLLHKSTKATELSHGH